MTINSQMRFFDGFEVLTDDMLFQNLAVLDQDKARISDMWTDGVIKDPNGLSNMAVSIDATTNTLFNVGYGTAYAHGNRIAIATGLGYAVDNPSFTTNGICTPRSTGNLGVPLANYVSGAANHVWAEYLVATNTGRTAVSLSDGTAHYPQDQDGYRVVVSLTNGPGNNDGITNAVYLATVYGQGVGSPLSSNPVNGLTDLNKVYVTNKPTASFTLSSGSVRGSSANVGGSQREILQGTVSTPDLRNQSVTPSKIDPTQSFAIGATSGGLHVGGSSDAGDNNLLVDGNASVVGNVLAEAGLHVGGTSDPGDNNLLVDGTLEVTGASTLTGLVKTVNGVHIGGTSDPGADNLLVDGTLEVTGASTLTGLVKTVGGVHVGGTSDPGADNLTVDGIISTNGLTVTGSGNSTTIQNNLGVAGTISVNGTAGFNGDVRAHANTYFSAGTVTAPSATFDGETDTGLYRIGPRQLALAILGKKHTNWETTLDYDIGSPTTTIATSLVKVTDPFGVCYLSFGANSSQIGAPANTTTSLAANITTNSSIGITIDSGGSSNSVNVTGQIFENSKRVFSTGSMFVSSEITISTNTDHTAAHSLGQVPSLFTVVIRCKTGEYGYAAGDEVLINSTYVGGTGPGQTAYANATNVGFYNATYPVIYDRTDASFRGITLANWKLVFRAWY